MSDFKIREVQGPPPSLPTPMLSRCFATFLYLFTRITFCAEESKEQEEDEESIDSRESYDGEIQSLRAMRYRTSLSSMVIAFICMN